MRETPDELDPARRPPDRYGAVSSASVPPLGGATRHAYDPNQPRVPAGHHEGGQWTATPGAGTPSQRREAILDRSGKESWHSYANTYRPDGTLAEQRVFNRDGSRIVSEFGDGSGRLDERHTVVTADRRKFVFENHGDVQTVYDEDGRPISVSAWTDNGPESLPSTQLAFAPAIPAAAATIGEFLATAAGRAAVQKAIEAAALLFTWYSRQNRPDAIAVLSFPAYVYDPRKAQSAAGATDEAVPISVAQVTEDELKEVCKEYVNVQKFTNEAAEKARAMRNDWTRQRFGTEVHKRVACEVNGEDKTTRKCRTAADAENPNFRAEASVRKTLEADPNAKMPVDLEDRFANYGERGTVRVDVFEKPKDHNAVCVYDIKTGEKILSIARIKEIIGAVRTYWPEVDQIFVVEVRPPAGVN
jgi:hypothetical protein